MEVCFQLLANFLELRVVAQMRSEVNIGMSVPILRPCGDRSALAAWSSAAWLHPRWGGVTLMSSDLGTRVDFTSRRPWEVPWSVTAARESWGKVAGPHPCLKWVRSLLPGELVWGSTAGSIYCDACAGFWGVCGKFLCSFLFLHIVKSEELLHPQTFHKRTVFNQ